MLDKGSYRLPTETEWEYFARAGTTTPFSFGADASSLTDHAWCGKNASQEVHPVGQKLPNAWRLFDVHGNVWEWCWDWYAEAYPSAATAEDYAGPKTGEYKVLRGGSFKIMAGGPRAAKRAKNKPTGSRDSFGLRIVQSVTR
ncbi:MAG: formylglycine-generating enzyme family protein [Nannocystaceae bacterium]|nr:formylglycine-generating enzyme family protein [Nannocystaceae bacterium]